MPVKVLKDGIPVLEIARLINGEVLGDASRKVFGLCGLDEPLDGCLAFCRETSGLKGMTGKLAALLVGLSATASDATPELPLIKVKDPQRALLDLIPLFFAEVKPAPGRHPLADIHPGARLAEDVCVGAFVSIGDNVSIGRGSVIHPHVVIYPNVEIGENTTVHSSASIREGCIIGSRVIIQNGAVIGADGFGYIPDPQLGLRSVPQMGIVRIADGVEIGANTCVDRATFGATIVGAGSKLDNLVQIGHNCRIGTHSILCGQAALAGSCEIGDQVVLGGASGVADHIRVASGCRVGAKSGVVTNLPDRGDYAGFPAIPAAFWRRQTVVLGEITRNFKTLRRLFKGEPREE